MACSHDMAVFVLLTASINLAAHMRNIATARRIATGVSISTSFERYGAVGAGSSSELRI
jgi:hypothetical protein